MENQTIQPREENGLVGTIQQNPQTQTDEISYKDNPLSYGYLVDRVIKIFCEERITPKKAKEFVDTLYKLKTLYGTRISKEFLKPYYTGNHKTKFRDRFNNVCDRAELKTELVTHYTRGQVMSDNEGNLYMENGKALFTFFVI